MDKHTDIVKDKFLNLNTGPLVQMVDQMNFTLPTLLLSVPSPLHFISLSFKTPSHILSLPTPPVLSCAFSSFPSPIFLHCGDLFMLVLTRCS